MIENGTTLLQAALTNDLLIPRSLPSRIRPIQGSLAFSQEFFTPGSRYLTEYVDISTISDVFFHTDVLIETNGLTQDGTAFGTVAIAAVASVPEPSMLALFGAGLVALGVVRRRHYLCREPRNHTKRDVPASDLAHRLASVAPFGSLTLLMRRHPGREWSFVLSGCDRACVGDAREHAPRLRRKPIRPALFCRCACYAPVELRNPNLNHAFNSHGGRAVF